MKPILAVLFIPVLLAGCSLSKDESTLARLHEKEANRKKERPKGAYTEEQVGVKFYPDSDEFQSRQYDEGGAHIVEVGLSTKDSPDKVREFYEKEIGAKSMPMVPPVSSIQADRNGKHYEVTYAQYDEEVTITIKIYTPTG